MHQLGGASIDAIVADPPYGLEFMGKEWDRLLSAPSGSPHARQHSVSFVNPGNPTCRKCGGLKSLESEGSGGRTKCRCADPDFPNHLLPRARAMQEWHEAWAREALRVLKPGGHLLAFGGTRTYHRLACAVEDAGFEIRDTIAWMYGSGFPKSLNVGRAIDKAARGVPQGGADPTSPNAGKYRTQATEGKRGEGDTGRGYGAGPGQFMAEEGERVDLSELVPEARPWAGHGTALKPAHEPIVVARKPLSGTVAGNVLEHGTGALNVDGCRIEAGGRPAREIHALRDDVEYHPTSLKGRVDGSLGSSKAVGTTDVGRWPANVVLDEEAARMLDEQTGERAAGRFPAEQNTAGLYGVGRGEIAPERDLDSGGASRFFYCAKAGAAERSAGLPAGQRSSHPTVKPIELMRWLTRLVTPPGGTVLDPFTGSGTTGCAAVLEGFDFIGIEREPEYAAIAEARIGWWEKHRGDGEADEILAAGQERDRREGDGQLSLEGWS